MAKPKILIVEDSKLLAFDLKNKLIKQGYRVPAVVATGEDAIIKSMEKHPDLVLMDIILKGNMDGIEAAEHIHKQHDIPIIYLTVVENDEAFQRAKKTEPFGYIVKPAKEKELHNTIEIALAHYRKERKLREAKLIQIENELIHSEESLRILFEDAPAAYFLYDLEGNLISINKFAEKLSGYKKEELIGKNIFKLELLPFKQISKASASLVKNMVGKLAEPDEFILRRKDGNRVIVEIKTDLIRINGVDLGLGIARDITERKKLQEQLIHSEKLSAVGELAAGVAHEFNNILAIIRGNVQLGMMDLENKEELLESLKIIDKQTKRGEKIVKDINVFAKPDMAYLELVDISQIINQTIEIMKKQLLLRNIRVETAYQEHSKVLIDSGQFQQVLLNLLINARDAIYPKRKGMITISVRNIGKQVEIRVADNGIGMDEKTRLNIFTPFFTTKGARARDNLGLNGTGLGLSLTHTIIRQHNGTISVESQKGKGTTFIILLPARGSLQFEKKDKEIELEQKKFKKTGELKILIVDDEKNITDIMSKILKLHGYNNIEISNSGKKALSIFKKNQFDLVFLDILMPDINGKIILKKMKKIYPAIPVVCMTGQLESEENTLIEKGAHALLGKPFNVNQILSILNNTAEDKKEV